MDTRTYVHLSDEQRAALEPMARMLRANGVELTVVICTLTCAAFRRRARQAKQRAHKQARAHTNRPKG